MRQFSIKELERFSGIKAHTIRVWEQRHSAFTPVRTEANLRRYSLHDLKLILDIALLVKYGYKISKLVMLTAEEIEQRTAALKDIDAQRGKLINNLIYCMYATDVAEFERQLDEAVKLWGVDATIEEVIIPFLERVQLLSYSNDSAEAHFVVTALRRKLIMGIEAATAATAVQQTALLFLPKDEHYDLMLLYANYVLKKCGLTVLYLGTNISKENLEKVCMEKKPGLLISYIYPKQSFALAEYTAAISRHLPAAKLYIVYAPDDAYMPTASNVQFIPYKELDKLCKEYC